MGQMVTIDLAAGEKVIATVTDSSAAPRRSGDSHG